MPSTSFNFGQNLQHTVDIAYGWFGGIKYFVDGKLVARSWSLKARQCRQFTAYGHDIEVKTWMRLTQARGEAFVDGECVNADLFAAFNASIGELPPDFDHDAAPLKLKAFMVRLGVWLALLVTLFLVVQSLIS